MIPDRAVRFPARTVLTVLLIVIAVWALLQVVLITRDVLTWILVALFLAIALAPAVDWLQRKGIRRRGYAVALTALAVAGVVALIGWLVIPQLVDQVNEFARKVPDYIDDLTKGRGRLGFLQTKYHIVERVREAVNSGRREQGVRPLRHGDLDHEERSDDGGRDDHDHRAHVLHAPRGADVDGALLLALLAADAGQRCAASAGASRSRSAAT